MPRRHKAGQHWLIRLLLWQLWLGLVLPRASAMPVPPLAGRFVFALADNSSDSTVGAIENARLVPTIHLGWGTQFYVDATRVPAGVVAALRRHGAEVVPVQPARVPAAPA
eukprot:EG_transcript_58911